MSMLSDFLDIRKQSKEHFKGLKIEKEEQICQQWMNQCPTIFFSMKDVDGLDFESAYQRLQALIANLCKEHTYLLESDEIDPDDKEIFLHLKAGNGNQSETTLAFATLMRMMHKYYKRKVIFLLDEYDVPIAKASDHGYYDQMLDIVKGMMSSSLKDNTDLNIAVITGCLKVAKESIFTGTNNFVSDTISSTRLNEYFGFTQREVDQILEDIEASAYAQGVKEWYDGYTTKSGERMYNPRSVVLALTNNNIGNYWTSSGPYDEIFYYIRQNIDDVQNDLALMISGEAVTAKIQEYAAVSMNLTTKNEIFSAMIVYGFLSYENGEVRIPNKELMNKFDDMIHKVSKLKAQKYNKKKWRYVQKQLKKSKKILYSNAATQKSINSAKSDLKKSINKLRRK